MPEGQVLFPIPNLPIMFFEKNPELNLLDWAFLAVENPNKGRIDQRIQGPTGRNTLLDQSMKTDKASSGSKAPASKLF
jgi:hypothetical protein